MISLNWIGGRLIKQATFMAGNIVVSSFFFRGAPQFWAFRKLGYAFDVSMHSFKRMWKWFQKHCIMIDSIRRAHGARWRTTISIHICIGIGWANGRIVCVFVSVTSQHFQMQWYLFILYNINMYIHLIWTHNKMNSIAWNVPHATNKCSVFFCCWFWFSIFSCILFN